MSARTSLPSSSVSTQPRRPWSTLLTPATQAQLDPVAGHLVGDELGGGRADGALHPATPRFESMSTTSRAIFRIVQAVSQPLSPPPMMATRLAPRRSWRSSQASDSP